MLPHLRRQIRDAVVAMLSDRLGDAYQVFPTRRHALQADHLPALLVYTVSEDSELMNMGTSRHLKRDLELMIEGVIEVTESVVARLDDRLDDVATDVEVTMAGDSSLGGLAYDCVLTKTVMALAAAPGEEKKTASAVMTFRVTYRSRKDDPALIN